MANSRGFDRHYGASEAVFGDQPDPLLSGFADRIAPGVTVLDVGAGQGRHALYLARRGWQVHAIDPSKVGIEQLERRVDAEGLPVRCWVRSWEDFEAAPGAYGAILLFGLVQLLTRPRVRRLARRAFEWSSPGGLLFVTGFTMLEAGCAARASDPAWSSEEPGSFVGPGGEVRTFLRPAEILELLAAFEVVHHWEGLGPEHRHGDGPAERHALVEAVLRRPE